MIDNPKILFADLDGTLIETKSGKTFPIDEFDWFFKPGIIEAIRNYNPDYLFIITNQGGIEKGFIDEEKFKCKIKNIQNGLNIRLNHIRLIAYEYCISNDKENPYRKPNIGMIERFKGFYENDNDNDNDNCLMIGDASGKDEQFSNSDKKCAENANIEYMDVEDFITKFYIEFK